MGLRGESGTRHVRLNTVWGAERTPPKAAPRALSGAPRSPNSLLQCPLNLLIGQPWAVRPTTLPEPREHPLILVGGCGCSPSDQPPNACWTTRLTTHLSWWICILPSCCPDLTHSSPGLTPEVFSGKVAVVSSRDRTRPGLTPLRTSFVRCAQNHIPLLGPPLSSTLDPLQPQIPGKNHPGASYCSPNLSFLICTMG